MMRRWVFSVVGLLLLAGGLAFFVTDKGEKPLVLLNASYDPTREFFESYNVAFVEKWGAAHGQTVSVQMSHGGSGKQARAVIDGLPADVVTLALGYDIDAIAERSGRIPADWQQALPHNSTPFYSTIVFLVRKGNPKQIQDWDDLVREGVKVITPNPKTSGGARWNYLAAWGYAMEHFGQDEAAAKGFMKQLFANVPILDTGARGSTMTFVQRHLGDVLITWENEAFLAKKEFPDALEMVAPSVSVRAEPPVALVERNAKKRGTEDMAKAYLMGLYDAEAQRLAVAHFFRPSLPEVGAGAFADIRMFTVADFGGWRDVQARHFADGGVFDQLYSDR